RVADARRGHSLVRHRALLAADDEHVRPLEALRAVHRRQRHLSAAERVLGLVVFLLLVHRLEEVVPARAPALGLGALLEATEALEHPLDAVPAGGGGLG